ncbi:MAG: DUF2231 domain-containing protein [Dehalococcoidia bacterium]
MESKVKLFGHPLHPMLIVFPLGLLSTALVFDVIHLVTGTGSWAEIAYWMIVAGIIGGLVAALAGWAEWTGIPSSTRAKSIGFVHGAGNMIVMGLFIASWILREFVTSPEAPGAVAIGLAAGGVALAAITGWLGGELVDRYGVGVHPGANLDAPSTLSRKPASSAATPSRATQAQSGEGRDDDEAERGRREDHAA